MYGVSKLKDNQRPQKSIGLVLLSIVQGPSRCLQTFPQIQSGFGHLLGTVGTYLLLQV